MPGSGAARSGSQGDAVASAGAIAGPAMAWPRLRAAVLTLGIVAAAAALGWAAWDAYMATPWTRDGTVRAYVIAVTPQVGGRIVALPAADDQPVRKGDPVLAIDQTDYVIAVQQAEAAVDLARAEAENATREAQRRAALSDLEVSAEQRQTFASTAAAKQAALRQAEAVLAQARVNLERTTIRSPVNGRMTNLLVQVGDYATAGQAAISLVDTDSFWIEGYFEETSLDAIAIGDPATARPMGSRALLRGRVEGIARGIAVANAQLGQGGLASVNPTFAWVRLAQRIPVRIRIEQVPEGVRLVAGRTVSVQIEPRAP
jgi:multidrug resistance efflux pump